MKDKDSPSTSVKDALGILEGLEHLHALTQEALEEIKADIVRKSEVGTWKQPITAKFLSPFTDEVMDYLDLHDLDWIDDGDDGYDVLFPDGGALAAFLRAMGMGGEVPSC